MPDLAILRSLSLHVKGRRYVQYNSYLHALTWALQSHRLFDSLVVAAAWRPRAACTRTRTRTYARVRARASSERRRSRLQCVVPVVGVAVVRRGRTLAVAGAAESVRSSRGTVPDAATIVRLRFILRATIGSYLLVARM